MSISWQHAEPSPRLLVLPPAAASLDEAHAAIELWEHYSGKRLDSAQRLTVEVMMAETSAGKWAAQTTGREMCRQQGKGDEIEVVELWGLVQRAEAIMHTVHDAVLLASQTQQRMLAVLEGHGDLRRKKKREWLGTGQQMIEMHNGGIIWYRTRTGGGGRGVDDVARLVVDEAQHAQEEHLAAVTPTLFANPNPQMNAMGTAGIAGKSAWWWQLRIRALAADPGDFGYVGHTAENVYIDDGKVVQDPVDPYDMTLVPDANPALHSGRGQPIGFFEEQLRRLGPKSYAREHLGVWDPPPTAAGESSWQFVPESMWNGAADPKAERGKRAVFGVDIGEDRLAHVGVAWHRPDGGVQVMLADPKPLSPLHTPDRLVSLTEKWKAKVVLGGPSAALESDVSRSLVASGTDFAEACGRFDDLLRAGELWHGNQPELNDAVKAATWRPYGTAGGRALALRNAPLVGPVAAAIRAVHGLFAAKTPPAAPQLARAAKSDTADLSSLSF